MVYAKKIALAAPNRIGPEVWAVGGGKGGVGKSFISSSLAVCLARMGKSVIVIDLDLGSANLHTCLGAKIPALGLSDFLSGRATDFKSLIAESDIPNLRFISGFNDALDVADLKATDRTRLMNAISLLPAGHVILDLGAGTSETTLDFFLSAHRQIVAVTPEPTAIENAYRFLKSSFYRKLRQAEGELGIKSLLDSAMDSQNSLAIRTPADLLRRVIEAHPGVGARFEAKIAEFHPSIVINQTRTRADVELGQSMRSVCTKYFGADVSYLGHVDHDNAVWQSLRKRRPLIIEYPYSSIVGQFLGITKNLMNPQSIRAVV